MLSSSVADSGCVCTCYWPVLAIPSVSQTTKDCCSFCAFVLRAYRAAFSSHSHRSHKAVLTSDALFTIHTKPAVLTCGIPFGTTIHTKLCSVEVPCSVQPFTQSCIQLRYPVQHHKSHKAVSTCGILFSTTIHTRPYSLAVSCSAQPFTQCCIHLRCLFQQHHPHKAVFT